MLRRDTQQVQPRQLAGFTSPRPTPVWGRSRTLRRWAAVLLAVLLAAGGHSAFAQAPELGWSTLILHTTSHGGSYDLTTAPAPPVRNPAALQGGDYALVGAAVGLPAGTALATAGDVTQLEPCPVSPAEAGQSVRLCLTLENVGATTLTHHRVIAPTLGGEPGLDTVIVADVAVNQVRRFSVEVTGPLPETDFVDVEVISTSGGPWLAGELPWVIFPTFATLAATVVEDPTGLEVTPSPNLRLHLPTLRN